MKNNKKNLRAVFLLFAAICIIMYFSVTVAYSRGTTEKYRHYFKDFPRFVKTLLSEWHVPGTVVGVVKNGSIIYLEGVGFRDIENKLKVNGETLFCICSCTKAFTSFAAAQLAAEGKLDWDTPIIKYIPDFALYDPYTTQQATMRDLLSHRTGVAQHDQMWKKSPFSREEMFKRLRYLQPTRKFRATYLYNNYMYMAAGHIVGRISGETWEQFVRKRILAPLGMKRTRFSIGKAEPDPNFAHPYRFDGKKFHRCWYYPLETIAPAGGITTSAANMCKWMIMHLNEGKYGETQLIPAKHLKETYKPVMPLWSDGKEEFPMGSYAMGWVYYLHRGKIMIWHGGGTRGYHATVSLLPREKLGIVVLSNYFGQPIEDIITFTIIDWILGLEKIDWYKFYGGGKDKSKEKKKPVKKKEKSGLKWSVPDGMFKKLAGVYEHPGYGQAMIQYKDGKLLFTYNTNVCDVEYLGYNNFHLITSPYKWKRLSVHLDVKGKIKSISIPFQEGIDDIEFKRLPGEN